MDLFKPNLIKMCQNSDFDLFGSGDLDLRPFQQLMAGDVFSKWFVYIGTKFG